MKKIVMMETVWYFVGQDGTQEGPSYDTEKDALDALKKHKKELKGRYNEYHIESRTTQVTS